MGNLQNFVTWSDIRQAWWKLMREHDECCKLSNPCKTKHYYTEELEKKCFGEAPRDSQCRIRRQEGYQRIKLQWILPYKNTVR